MSSIAAAARRRRSLMISAVANAEFELVNTWAMTRSGKASEYRRVRDAPSDCPQRYQRGAASRSRIASNCRRYPAAE